MLTNTTHSGFLELAKYPLLEIGGHTRDHYDLGGNLRVKDIEEQIFSDRIQLQNWCGRKVKWFAYPLEAQKLFFNFPKNSGSAGYEAPLPSSLSESCLTRIYFLLGVMH